MSKKIGITAVPSTTLQIQVILDSNKEEQLDTLKDKMAYFEILDEDKNPIRALASITEVTTNNNLLSNKAHQAIVSDIPSDSPAYSTGDQMRDSDFRETTLQVSSVFSFDKEKGTWASNKPLPNSPSSGTSVHLVDKEDIKELFKEQTEAGDLSFIGTIRGTKDIPAPVKIPDFGSSRGASHSAFLGKTGSGKNGAACYVTAAYMQYSDHTIIAVDPQGQWNNENGFVFSLKALAESLGREVFSIRVSENIKLELNEDNFVEILQEIDLWSKVGRMGKENRDLLSVEVAEHIIYNMPRSRVETTEDYRGILSEALYAIINSPAAVARIYASEDRQNAFKMSINDLVNPAESLILAYINANTKMLRGLATSDSEIREAAIGNLLEHGKIILNPRYNSENDESSLNSEYTLNEADLTSIDNRWAGILNKFVPLLNLFQRTNLNGGTRRSLDGDRGYFTDFLRVRSPHETKPAPYVILDMSPDMSAKAKSELMGGQDNMLNMRRMLDNESIKAAILKIVFMALNEASETAYHNGNNKILNTQIILDEARRYAPDRSENERIMELSKLLERYATDTRKYGLGWTYILQSPSDLRQGIWQQIKNVYSGYGLMGNDLRKLGDLMSDSDTGIRTYKQFVSPDQTGNYPFMITGSLSPLITSQIPLFVNMYNDPAEFLKDNEIWLKRETSKYSRPMVQLHNIKHGQDSHSKSLTKKAANVTTGYTVGGTKQVTAPVVEVPKSNRVKDNNVSKTAPPF